jgi:hypothetical protein
MPGQFVDGRIAFLKAELKITPAQETQWQQVAAAMRENAKDLDQTITTARQNRTDMDAVQRLEVREQFAKVRADNDARLVAAFKLLYASLSPEQQQTANQLVGAHHHWHHRAWPAGHTQKAADLTRRLFFHRGANCTRHPEKQHCKTGACLARPAPHHGSFEDKALMMTDAAAIPGTGGEIRPEKRSKRSEEYRALAVVSLAHFVNHFQNLVVPPLFPFLKAQLGIGFVELGLALPVANILSVVALPVRSRRPRWLMADACSDRHQRAGFHQLRPFTLLLRLLLAMALLGLANGVFHPADCAILSARTPPPALAVRFDPHLFRLWHHIAPVTMLAVAASLGHPR